jgi:hypothetical protein
MYASWHFGVINSYLAGIGGFTCQCYTYLVVVWYDILLYSIKLAGKESCDMTICILCGFA